MKHKVKGFLTSPNFWLLIAVLISMQVLVRAQQFTGTIQGSIQDSTGAVVAGAEVSVINISTNETRSLMTNAAGTYLIPQLKPSLYRVTVKKAGFKSATIDQIKLDVQQIREVNVVLEVGQASESVTVTSSGSGAIETSSSTVSQTIENKRIVDLPLNGRNPFALATMSPGVIPAPGSSPFISGGRNATSEVTIDGVSNVNAENNVSILDLNYTPSVDAVQEFNVQTNAVSAEFGRLGGGVINLVTKSGTSQYHVTAFEFMRNSVFDANNFFSNRSGVKKGSFKRNQFGGNLGGPVRLPGYNGQERTFFFFNYEGLRERAARVTTGTVPLPEWRNGDFSNLRDARGNLIPIYDPLTTRANPAYNPALPTSAGNTPLIRDQFSYNGRANVIAPNRIDPVARALMQYYPLPNTAPSNSFTQQNNFIAAGTSPVDSNRIDTRVDHNFNNKWRAFLRFSWSGDSNQPVNLFQNAANSTGGGGNGDGPTFTSTKSVSMDHTYTVSPTLVLDLRLGLNRRYVDRRPLSAGFDLASLGLAPNVVGVAQQAEFPRIDVQNFSSLGQNTFTDLVIAPTTYTFNANATKTLRNHTFKFGMDYRKFMLNFLQ
ncbi:MAG TPA: carboxypeptidase regulatory-like domain-containing protein, partial [Blastocatellia bacterium]|nr:carboxypeptidase regulatory-like domain-containing protein [Blastocatellia bacterium]